MKIDINTRDDTKKQINDECASIYQKKLELCNTLLERININYKKSNVLQEHRDTIMNPDAKIIINNIVYKLEEDITKCPVLAELNAFIPNFMFFLWKQPNVICKLLLKAKSRDLQETLSDFFCNNFFENILSPNYTEPNLLYLITLLLKEEINNINYKSSDDPTKYINNFLNDTPGSFLLEQFNKKQDVVTFFKTILFDIIEDLELTSGNREIFLDLHKIEQEIIAKNKSRKSSCDYIKSTSSKDMEGFLQMLSQNNENEFIKKNIVDLNNDFFQQMVMLNKDNDKLLGFFLYYMDKVENAKNKYSPETFLKLNLEEEMNQQIINEYEKNFDKIIELINHMFENLMDNFYLLPYSIKCICKIIFSLVQKKLQKLNSFHHYAFMAKFLFDKLLIPIFQNPGLGSLINTFIISTTTMKNIELISKILMNFVSGTLFKANKKEEDSFTPFNNFFISKMPDLMNFFDEILNVKLPVFLEKCINDELTEDFEYDYFKENPEEVVFHRSVCFTIHDLDLLLNLMDNNKKIIFNISNKKADLIKLEKTFEKLICKKSREIIQKLKNNPEYEIIDVPVYKKKKIKEYKKEKGRQIIKYYLISDLCLNKKYQDIFNVSQKTKFFNLPELKNIKDEKEEELNTIIKVKNFFCTILYNYRKLIKTDFEEDKIKDIRSLLDEIKRFMKASHNINEGTSPYQWFINSLLDYLDKIPEDLTKDNCEALINQIQEDVNNAIKSLDFEELSVLIEKMKFAKEGKIYYEKAKNLIIDIHLNKKAQSIVEKDNIEVEILVKYNEKNKEFNIDIPKKNEKNLQYLDNIFAEPKKKNSRICKTIKMFTQYFPNFLRYEEYFKVDVLQIEKELKVPQKLEKYFKIIQDYIKANLDFGNEKESSDIFDKICDYIMEKLYEKLYPKNMVENDEQIYSLCEKLGWVEPKHFIKSKNNFIYESFLPDLSNYLLSIEKEKSVRKKLNNLKAIFQCMNYLGKLNGEKQFDLDEQIRILNYVFIKAKPSQIWANTKYMELFLGNKKDQIEGQNLASLSLICEHILNISAVQLNGVGKEDFDNNCAKSLEKIRVSRL